MSSEVLASVDVSAASIGRTASLAEGTEMHGRYEVECRDANGVLRWRDHIDNVVTTVGKNDLLDKYLSGSAYTAAWYLGLISATGYTGAPAAGDTMASHSNWAEDQNYSQGARPTAAFAAASAGSKALSSALTYSMNATTTIKGCFVTSVSTKGGTTGILFSAGLFTGGDKPTQNGDTLSVSYTASAT